MVRAALIAALLLTPGAALAQQAGQDAQAASGQPPKRVRQVTLTGDQKCPPSTSEEVVVCGRVDEPYRIPKALRDDKPIPAQNQSWVNRAATIDQVGRVAGGIPDTCSPVGTGGQSGCSMTWNRQYSEERRARRAEAIPPSADGQ
ncbi:hypothetical protein QE385_000996 [Sphingomonas sp. SORGH_AS 950]|uniref:hypothetical protein n=1 Tax=Sphingomonas sp. SORGH_AS_0950 TaxID=3041792 RepID=UPI00278BA207|nr:hypothetical protein [Sphingomonas sp. SORGH_AS_0950]MDQ1156669.1 hypothetical protein [Sphingomonas sp. SORGH_AS_0950]